MPGKGDTESDAIGLNFDQELIRLRKDNARISGERETLKSSASEAMNNARQLNGMMLQLLRGADGMVRSRRWRLGHFLASLKYLLMFRPMPSAPADSIKKVKAKYDQWLSGVGQEFLLTRVGPEKSPMTGKKPKVTVITWSVESNSLGRAYILAESLAGKYEVEIIGPMHSWHSAQIWEPLRDTKLGISYFEGDSANYCRYFSILKKIAERIDSDIIYISKLRMPSLILAALVKSRRNVPLILDIDDHELSFFKNRSPISLQKIKSLSGKAELDCLHGETWTRYADSLVKHFDAVTVSNVALQKKYGGTIIPHLRDEAAFKPSASERAKIRKEFGYKDSDKVILFVGTPKWHKGLGDIIQALDKAGNPSFNLCIIGTVRDEALKRRLKAQPNVKVMGNTSFFDLPKYLQLADLICILQDPSSPVSQYQLPAKFTDALSMGIPIIAYDVPPLRPYHESGLLEFVKRESLPAKLVEVFENYGKFKNTAVKNISSFNKEFSYEAGSDKLTRVFDEAVKANKPLSDEFERLIDFLAASCEAPI